MTTQAITRSLRATNGETTREIVVIERSGGYWLHDVSDTNFDGDVLLADDTDTSINDALREGGFEIAQ